MDTVKSQKPFLFKPIKGALIASALGVALVALFAFLLLKAVLPAESVPYVNAGIKAACAAFGAYTAIRRSHSRNMLVGALAGVGYMLISYAVFSLISGGFSFNVGLVSDLLMCAAAGAAVGIFRNLRT